MPRSNRLLRALPLLAIGVLLLWALYHSIEFYEETEKSRWSAEALANPYLAAMQFLEQSEIPVGESDSLLKLNNLDTAGTVLITDANSVINPRQLDTLLGWLEQGGNLIVSASPQGDDEDLLLQYFDVRVEWYRQDADADSTEQSISDSMREYNDKIEQGMTPEQIAAEYTEAESLTTVAFDQEIGILEVAFANDKVLTHPGLDTDSSVQSDYEPMSWSSSDYGVHLIQFEVGDGLLTIISDPTVWISHRIQQHDHAYLLWLLISLDGEVLMLHPRLRDSLWALLQQHTPELLLALLGFVCLLLWQQAHRFGRIEPVVKNTGRSLSEHFSVTANYLWQHAAVEHLLAPLRQQVLRRAGLMIARFPQAGDDRSAQFAAISRHTGLSREQVEMAFQHHARQEMSFIQTVKLLQQIEKSL